MAPTATTEQRKQLLMAVERDREELRLALQQLGAVARRKVHVGQANSSRPLPYLVAGLALGLWLGARHG